MNIKRGIVQSTSAAAIGYYISVAGFDNIGINAFEKVLLLTVT